tara:strand:- start:6446 stop:6871 length:426 start_codon:yes stop_codon:yes gene_type:complete
VSHPRSDMRAQVRAALEASPDLAGVKVYRSWAQSLGQTNLPAIGVATPSERTRGATGNSVDRDTALIVQYVQTGDDELDDHLDDISAVIEPLVLEALSGFELFEITSTDIEISGEGETLTGRLTLTFSATRFTPEGQAAAL